MPDPELNFRALAPARGLHARAPEGTAVRVGLAIATAVRVDSTCTGLPTPGRFMARPVVQHLTQGFLEHLGFFDVGQ